MKKMRKVCGGVIPTMREGDHGQMKGQKIGA